MSRFKARIIIYILAALTLSSCGSSSKKVPYFTDIDEVSAQILSQTPVQDPVIGIGDLLNISVSGANMAAMAPFNKNKYIDPEGRIGNLSQTNSQLAGSGLEVSMDYYLVNADGSIDFPIIGKIEVAGLTKQQVADKISGLIYPKYVTEKPVIDIRLMNFRVTIIGAVKAPGQYQSKNERMTFLEAISLAGDLDIQGDRENILLYRTNVNGTREAVRINLHDNSLFTSPYYNLQQNDVIYVVPNKSMRSKAWSLNPGVQATITVVGGISSLASLIIGIVNLSK
ncbi:MAG: polysaccharide biosynthesis/export family protein [Muribaculaceae bacterium]|nr:polysaccharide biosynthesis/export family protein [Muribaculaceae bacterium]